MRREVVFEQTLHPSRADVDGLDFQSVQQLHSLTLLDRVVNVGGDPVRIESVDDAPEEAPVWPACLIHILRR